MAEALHTEFIKRPEFYVKQVFGVALQDKMVEQLHEQQFSSVRNDVELLRFAKCQNSRLHR